MPRSEQNNPTERIGRLLDEYSELEAYAIQLEEELAVKLPELFKLLPARPTGISVVQEKVRRQLSFTDTRNKRRRMARIRLEPESRQRFPLKKIIDSASELQEALAENQLSEQRMEELAREADADSALQPEEIPDKGFLGGVKK